MLDRKLDVKWDDIARERARERKRHLLVTAGVTSDVRLPEARRRRRKERGCTGSGHKRFYGSVHRKDTLNRAKQDSRLVKRGSFNIFSFLTWRNCFSRRS